MKPIRIAVIGVASVLVLCGLPIMAALDDSAASAACSADGVTATASLDTGHLAAVGQWNAEQVANAATIVAVGRQQAIPARGWVIAVATAMQESRLINLGNLGARNDHDSLGLFQQRPSTGWGTPAQILNPIYASTKFYAALQRVPHWQSLPLTVAAQQVQHSAYPDRYGDHEADATKVVADIVSGDPDATDLGQCVSACPSTAASPVSPAPAPAGACGEPTGVFARAASWLTAWAGGPVPYLSSNTAGDLFQGYRRDCSGYVSMALGLAKPGLTTVDLAARSTVLAKSDLQPGDLMINPAFNLQGHVVLFERWTDSSMTRYWGFEQSGDGGTHHRQIPYPYYGSYQMRPYRLQPQQ